MTTEKTKPVKKATYVYLPFAVDKRARICLEDGREALTGRITDISQIFMYGGWLYATFSTVNSIYQSVPVYISQDRLSLFKGTETLADESVVTDKYGKCYGLNKIMGVSEDGIVILEKSGEYMICKFG